MEIRKRIFGIVERDDGNNYVSKCYDLFMLTTIVVSFLPLMFMTRKPWFRITETITTAIFIIDYFLRWVTADFRLKKKGWSFLLYPVSPMAIIDILSILPG